MKILCSIARRNRTALLWLFATALPQVAVAQVWVASTGVVDESSPSTYEFTGQAAFVRSSVATAKYIASLQCGPGGRYSEADHRSLLREEVSHGAVC